MQDKDIKTQVYELTGKAGTICGMTSDEAITRMLFSSIEEISELEYDIIDMKTDSRSEVLSVINWAGYIAEARDWDEKQRRRKLYMRSPAWKRKRDMVIARARKPMPIPENPIVHRSYDRYGWEIVAIEVDWKPICERENCKNIATQVHHLHYDTLGRENVGPYIPDPENDLFHELRDDDEFEFKNDLIAICGECHFAISKKI